MSDLSSSRPKIAISACLMGAEVRYNGGHKESRLCSRTLTEYFDFVPVCPEVAIGLGIPREPIRLVGDPDQPEAIGTVNPSINVTEPLAEYGQKMAGELNDICGYIFMQQSPSCGLERVKVYHANGAPVNGGGRGIYAQAFCAEHPDLPVEEAGRLNDPVLRENFITRVFAYSAWQHLLEQGPEPSRPHRVSFALQIPADGPQPGAIQSAGQTVGQHGEQRPCRTRPALLQRADGRR